MAEQTSRTDEGAKGGRTSPLPPGIIPLLVVAVLLVRVVMWMQSDLWYDEVVTLAEFAIGGTDGSLSDVCRHYPIANNHILFSAILWVWVRLTGFSLVEPITRLPALVFAILTVLVVLRLWRASLGRRVAVYAALLFAASPVLSPFYYQLRGYSLTFLLAAMAMAGAAELARGDVRQGAWQAALPCLLLPLVIPSNVLLVGALALFVLLAGEGGWGKRVGGAAVLAVAGALGGAYYLTIWPQFTKVMQQTAGWDSGWLVAGNVLLALVAHLGPVAVVAVACAFSRSHLVGHARDERREALILLGACALAVTGGILVSQRAPFPRVFAVFLVPATWAAFRLCRQAGFWQAHGMLRVAGAILISAFLWERGADLITQRQVAVGEHPQNLLQQFYRGDSELSGLVLTLKAKEMDRDMIVVTNGHDFRTFDFYWRIRGLTTEADSPIPGLGIRHVIAVNDASCAATCEQAFGRGLFVSVLAHGEEEAARLVGECGQTGRLEKIVEMGSRGIYTLIPLGRDVVAPPRPSDQS